MSKKNLKIAGGALVAGIVAIGGYSLYKKFKNFNLIDTIDTLDIIPDVQPPPQIVAPSPDVIDYQTDIADSILQTDESISNQISEQINENQEKIRLVNETLAETLSKETSLKTEISLLIAQLNNLDTGYNITYLKAEKNRIKNDIDFYESEISNLNKSIANFEAKNTDNQNKINTINNTFDGLGGQELHKVAEELGVKGSWWDPVGTKNNLEALRTSLINNMALNQGFINGFASEVAENQKLLDAKQDSLTKINEKLGNYEIEYTETERLLNNKRELLQTLQALVISLQKQIDELDAQQVVF